MEKFSNNASTTLNGAINNSVTSLVVTSASGFPTGGNFRIRIDDEIIKVTAVSSTTFTIARGQENTTAASHSNLATVTHILTSEAIDQLKADLVQSDTIANESTTDQKTGHLYLPTDGMSLDRFDGSAFKRFGPFYPLRSPLSTGWTAVNQTSGGLATTNGVLYANVANQTGSNNINSYVKTIPSAPYTITLGVMPLFPQDGSFPTVGMVLRNSSSTKLITFGRRHQYSAYDMRLMSQDFDNNTTFASSNFNNYWINQGPITYLRITDDNTNRIFYCSNDGYNFTKAFSEGRTVHMTPDQIGFFIDNYGSNGSNGYQLGMNIFYWDGP
jgi:hypothetical protein